MDNPRRVGHRVREPPLRRWTRVDWDHHRMHSQRRCSTLFGRTGLRREQVLLALQIRLTGQKLSSGASLQQLQITPQSEPCGQPETLSIRVIVKNKDVALWNANLSEGLQATLNQ